MGKHEGDSWIIYLLLMKYVFSINTCESGASLGELKFGYFLPRSAFTTKYHVSPYQCAIECHLRIQRCKSFNYRRSALSCQLCEEDSGPGGKNLQPNDGSIHSNIDTWKHLPIGHCNSINCSRTERCDSSKKAGETNCVPTECPFAELKLGMTIEPSNETVVRTKARRRCKSHDMERGDAITTCLENEATWSDPDFKCVCNTPPTKYGAINEMAEVEVGQNYTYKCQSGLFEKGDLNPTITCLEYGSWTSTQFQCVKQNWTEDTIYLKNIHRSDLISNLTGIDLLKCMRLCDDNWKNCLSFFYDFNSSQCLFSSSFRRGLPENLQSSAGLVYYTAPSNSCDMGYMNISLGGLLFCIKSYSNRTTFDKAMEICESEKAKLLIITNGDQIADLNAYLLNDWTYAGISDKQEEGTWVGWDGAVVEPLWYPREPSGTIAENCGFIASNKSGLLDNPCNNNYYFICSKTYYVVH